jgi:hypothetical protein
MGTWGAGLYSSDIAADMRATIKSVLRLPLDEDGIVDVLRNCEGRVANNPDDEDYTTFWLVLADQFEKRGVAHAPTRSKAISIIDRGDDLAMMEKRGMKAPDLRKRGAKLAELRARLAGAPTVSKTRATLQSPEPYVLEIGVLYACPVKGANINPIGGKKNRDGTLWAPDGWRQFVILNRGRAFDFLAWYQPLVCKKPVTEMPRLSDAGNDLWWDLDSPKTCPQRHFEELGLQAIGSLPIDMEKARERFQKTRPGIVYLGWDGRADAVNGITISETMFPSSHDWGRWYGADKLPPENAKLIRSLDQILAVT